MAACLIQALFFMGLPMGSGWASDVFHSYLQQPSLTADGIGKEAVQLALEMTQSARSVWTAVNKSGLLLKQALRDPDTYRNVQNLLVDSPFKDAHVSVVGDGLRIETSQGVFYIGREREYDPEAVHLGDGVFFRHLTTGASIAGMLALSAPLGEPEFPLVSPPEPGQLTAQEIGLSPEPVENIIPTAIDNTVLHQWLEKVSAKAYENHPQDPHNIDPNLPGGTPGLVYLIPIKKGDRTLFHLSEEHRNIYSLIETVEFLEVHIDQIANAPGEWLFIIENLRGLRSYLAHEDVIPLGTASELLFEVAQRLNIEIKDPVFTLNSWELMRDSIAEGSVSNLSIQPNEVLGVVILTNVAMVHRGMPAPEDLETALQWSAENLFEEWTHNQVTIPFSEAQLVAFAKTQYSQLDEARHFNTRQTAIYDFIYRVANSKAKPAMQKLLADNPQIKKLFAISGSLHERGLREGFLEPTPDGDGIISAPTSVPVENKALAANPARGGDGLAGDGFDQGSFRLIHPEAPAGFLLEALGVDFDQSITSPLAARDNLLFIDEHHHASGDSPEGDGAGENYSVSALVTESIKNMGWKDSIRVRIDERLRVRSASPLLPTVITTLIKNAIAGNRAYLELKGSGPIPPILISASLTNGGLVAIHFRNSGFLPLDEIKVRAKREGIWRLYSGVYPTFESPEYITTSFMSDNELISYRRMSPGGIGALSDEVLLSKVGGLALRTDEDLARIGMKQDDLARGAGLDLRQASQIIRDAGPKARLEYEIGTAQGEPIVTFRAILPGDSQAQARNETRSMVFARESSQEIDKVLLQMEELLDKSPRPGSLEPAEIAKWRKRNWFAGYLLELQRLRAQGILTKDIQLISVAGGIDAAPAPYVKEMVVVDKAFRFGDQIQDAFNVLLKHARDTFPDFEPSRFMSSQAYNRLMQQREDNGLINRLEAMTLFHVIHPKVPWDGLTTFMRERLLEVQIKPKQANILESGRITELVSGMESRDVVFIKSVGKGAYLPEDNQEWIEELANALPTGARVVVFESYSEGKDGVTPENSLGAHLLSTPWDKGHFINLNHRMLDTRQAQRLQAIYAHPWFAGKSPVFQAPNISLSLGLEVRPWVLEKVGLSLQATGKSAFQGEGDGLDSSGRVVENIAIQLLRDYALGEAQVESLERLAQVFAQQEGVINIAFTEARLNAQAQERLSEFFQAAQRSGAGLSNRLNLFVSTPQGSLLSHKDYLTLSSGNIIQVVSRPNPVVDFEQIQAQIKAIRPGVSINLLFVSKDNILTDTTESNDSVITTIHGIEMATQLRAAEGVTKEARGFLIFVAGSA